MKHSGPYTVPMRVVRESAPAPYPERFGGYFASFGTFGLGLLDLWREPNRRLTHDRVSNTIVVRRGRISDR